MPNKPAPVALLPNPYYEGDRPATKRTPVMHYWASIPDEVLQFPGFTCLPVAVWNARVMVDMPTEVKRLDTIRRRVMQQMGLSNRQKGTPVLRYLETHNARSRDVQFVSHSEPREAESGRLRCTGYHGRDRDGRCHSRMPDTQPRIRNGVGWRRVAYGG